MFWYSIGVVCMSMERDDGSQSWTQRKPYDVDTSALHVVFCEFSVGPAWAVDREVEQQWTMEYPGCIPYVWYLYMDYLCDGVY